MWDKDWKKGLKVTCCGAGCGTCSYRNPIFTAFGHKYDKAAEAKEAAASTQGQASPVISADEINELSNLFPVQHTPPAPRPPAPHLSSPSFLGALYPTFFFPHLILALPAIPPAMQSRLLLLET
jgi:hypothetical protein